VGLECNVEVDGGAGGRVAQILPVGWSGIPGMFRTDVIPRYEGCREVGEGHGGEEGERREPVVSHEYRKSVTKVVSAIPSQRDYAIQKARGPESPKHRNAEFLLVAEMQSFYNASVRTEVEVEREVPSWYQRNGRSPVKFNTAWSTRTPLK